SVAGISNSYIDIDVTGQVVTVDFSAPLTSPIGQVGHPGGTVTVTIPVRVRNNLPYTPTVVPLENTATATADNTADQTATAVTNLDVPLHLATVATKTFAPSTVLGVAGSTTTVTVGGTNTSNSPVDSFIIQDPIDDQLT